MGKRAPFMLDDLSPDELQVRRLNALSNLVRLEIMRMLVAAGEQGVTVGKITTRMGVVGQSTVSHHLNHLVGVGLVIRRKNGPFVHCVVNHDAIRDVIRSLVAELVPESQTSAS